MALYSIQMSAPPDGFAERIRAKFPNAAYQLFAGDNRSWIVRTDIPTSKEVGEQLEITDGRANYMIIVPVTTYYGWHQKDLWEFLSPPRSAI